MKQPHYLILSVLTFLVLSGCIRLKEEPVPWSLQPLPVVYSILTPDSTVKVFLASTYTGKMDETYLDAKAFIIEENGRETELFRQDSVFTDTLHAVKVEKGKTYKLQINLDNGTTIKAETTVPRNAASFSEYSFTPVDTINNSQLSAYFRCKWTVPPLNSFTDDYRIYTSWQWDVDAVKTSPTDYSVAVSRLIYPAQPGDYTISLFTTDVWLSRLLMNKYHQENSIVQGTDITSVLAAEFKGVLPDFSNIENGVGIFGSYLIHTRDLQGNIIRESK